LRNTKKRSTPQHGIEELSLQPAIDVQNAQQTEAGANQGKGEQNTPAPDPSINELMIRRIMAALMVEE
jgi:hypothetical protein